MPQKYVKKCDPCQRIGKPTTRSAMPLHPILAQIPFEKWGIDFVRPIKPPSRRGQCRYILIATKYVTKWPEAIPTKTDDVDTVAKFIYEILSFDLDVPKNL